MEIHMELLIEKLTKTIDRYNKMGLDVVIPVPHPPGTIELVSDKIGAG